MRFMGFFVVSSFLALAACGSHNHAPVVYGSDPAHQARITNSPSEAARYGRAAYPAATARRVPSGQFEQAQLTPVSAVYLSPEETGTPGAAAPSASGAGVITVRPGDTVYAIARRYQVTPQSIIDVNNLRPPYGLEVGQSLRLPNGAASLRETPVRQVVARDTLYQVRPGDTLFSISRASGVYYKTIAQANGLTPPYDISVGQQLLLPQARVGDPVYTAAAPARPTPSEPRDVADIAQTVSYTPPPQPADPGRLFDWPVKGAVVASYGAGELGRRNDGVNIAAPAGTPVRAAADGEVVYRGSELDGFGNLLLVKHTDGFVTAYAHNDTMLVKKGQIVRQGQVIAKVGKTGSVSSPQLHFEIRQNLKSIDPVALLGPQ